jgi:release factor H-coupled RctB family protein
MTDFLNGLLLIVRSWQQNSQKTLGLKLGDLLTDLCHNFVEIQDIKGIQICLHRKGANPSSKGSVFIAGSRGTNSLLVTPLPTLESLYTLPHGCGRKYNRGDMLSRGRDLMKGEDFNFMNGTHVICSNKNLVYEEHPSAYKDITQITDCLLQHKLIDPAYSEIKPLLNYKTTEQSHPKKKKKHNRAVPEDTIVDLSS